MSPTGEPQAQLLAPGHPLLDATVDMVLERYRPLLKQGAMLVADADETRGAARARLRGARDPERPELDDGQRQVVSKRLQFVELTEDWEAAARRATRHTSTTGRSRPTSASSSSASSEDEWLDRGVEKAGLDYAIMHAVPEHLAEVQAADAPTRRSHEGGSPPAPHQRDPVLGPPRERAEGAGARRQAAAHELRSRPSTRRRPQARLKRRMTELDQEAQLSPLPPVVGRRARHPARATRAASRRA